VVGSFTFVLQASGADLGGVASRAESEGFDGIGVPDHPGSTWSPFVALAGAAAGTERLLLGTSVLNCGVREPLDIAADTAALQALSQGRVVLGVGAGHTPSEWSQLGRTRPSPPQRVERFEEVLRCVVALLGGEAVTLKGSHVSLCEARLQMELPAAPVLLVGGGNRRLVRLGCELADVVELGGTGRALPDGHYHETRWSKAQVDAVVEVFEAGCSALGRRPVLGALVQHVELSDDAEHAGRRWLDRAARVVPAEFLPSVADLLACPYVLIGSPGELATKLAQLRDRWGFTRFTVRSIEPLIEVFTAIGPTATRSTDNA
jgi:probable F420-dependent oxidoreductase